MNVSCHVTFGYEWHHNLNDSIFSVQNGEITSKKILVQFLNESFMSVPKMVYLKRPYSKDAETVAYMISMYSLHNTWALVCHSLWRHVL